MSCNNEIKTIENCSLSWTFSFFQLFQTKKKVRKKFCSPQESFSGKDRKASIIFYNKNRFWLILRVTFPEVGEGDVEFNPCCRWYIFGASIDGGAPRLPGATATLVMVVSYDGRSPRLLPTTCPRPSAISVIGHPRTVTSETRTNVFWTRFRLDSW